MTKRPPYKKQDKLCKHCGNPYKGCGNSKWCGEGCKAKNKRLKGKK